MVLTSLTIQDILPFNHRVGAKKVDLDAVIPFFLVPILLVIATISRIVTAIVMVIIAMGVLYIYTRPRPKYRTPFFFSWTLSSGVYLFLVFEFGVLTMLEITQLENLTVLILLTLTCYCFYKVRTVADFELSTGSVKGKEYSPVLTSDSHYCHLCQLEINERFFHSLWWDCCIFRPNYMYFVAGTLFANATILYGTNLGLTTVCQPFIFFGTILMPEDCSDVYYEFDLAICFVSCVYGVGYIIVNTLTLIQQAAVYIPRFCEPQWRRVVNILSV